MLSAGRTSFCRVHHDGSEIAVTLSVGYASTSNLDVDDEMDLVGLADEALYKAKRQGRNVAVAATAPGSGLVPFASQDS